MAEAKTEEELKAEEAAKTSTDDSKKYEADKDGNVSVPLDVLMAYKNDMHKYKGERNELKTSVQELTTKVETMQTVNEEAANKKLLEDGEFKELAEKREQQLKDSEKKNQDILIDSEIKVEALKIGANNVNDVISLFDKSLITVNETGQIEGVSEAMKAFNESKPYLFGDPKANDKIDVHTGRASTIPPDKKYEDLLPSQLMQLKKDNPELYKSLEADYDKRFGTKSPT